MIAANNGRGLVLDGLLGQNGAVDLDLAITVLCVHLVLCSLLCVLYV